MRVTDLIAVGQPELLHHPILGRVDWRDDPHWGWGLYHSTGDERGWLVSACVLVLLDNRWTQRKRDNGGNAAA